MSSSNDDTITSPDPVVVETPSPEPGPEPEPASADSSEDDGMWGLSSAFGSGWGLGGKADGSGGGGAGASDAELAELESSIAAAETAVSTAIWSTLSAVSGAVSGATGAGGDDASKKKENDANAPLSDADLDAILTGEEAPQDTSTDAAAPTSLTAPTPVTPRTPVGAAADGAAPTAESPAPAPAPTTSIWSSLGAAVSETLGSTTAPDPASSLYSLYTSNVNRAAEWIEDLEKADQDKDPYKRLKEHLNAFVTANPRGSYEEWVELYLSEEGWDKSSTIVVDSSYYAEECPHRNLWNERNYQDGIQIGDPNPQRAYVPTPSTKKDRRHHPNVSTQGSEEEMISFGGDAEDAKSSKKELFNDDGSSVIVVPTPGTTGQSTTSLDKSMDSTNEDGILVPESTPKEQ